MAEDSSRVLIADDNKVNRLLLSRSVELLGHRVMLAENGRIALEKLQSEPFDLLLLDIEMPELDGFAVLEQLKADRQLREVPVIVTSSVEGLDNVVRCINLGAEDYLHKPANAVLLNARIGGALTRKRLRDQELQYLNAVADVSAAAVAIELDIFEPSMLDPAAARPDAIGHLARVVQSMAREIQARHDALQRDKP